MVAHSRRSHRKAGIVDRLKDQAGEVTDLLRNGARTVKQQAAETAGEVTSALRGEATRLINTQKSRAATRIHSVGWAAHKAAQLLSTGKADAAGRYVDLAAQSVEQASKYLEENELAQIADDGADLVRRHPRVAITILLFAGLAAGRFVKAGLPVQPARGARRKRNGRRKHPAGARRVRG
jgi:hypothetical protein